MAQQTFDFTHSSRWTLLKMLTMAFIDKKISLAWEPEMPVIPHIEISQGKPHEIDIKVMSQ